MLLHTYQFNIQVTYEPNVRML